jgi:transposase
MRYELSDEEWTAIKPMLPHKPRGVPRVNDRRVLNGIFWVLRSGAPWRDLPDDFGPYTTCYNRFVRWRRAGVWSGIMDALAKAHDASVQMIDTSIVRVHQHGACIIRNRKQSMGRSRGGLTSKIHAVVDTNGLPVRLGLTAGEAHVPQQRPKSRRAELVERCHPRTHAMQQKELYSITSSARASNEGGTLRPRALAALRLITSPYLVGACTGRSAGFSPLRMRST